MCAFIRLFSNAVNYSHEDNDNILLSRELCVNYSHQEVHHLGAMNFPPWTFTIFVNVGGTSPLGCTPSWHMVGETFMLRCTLC